MLDDQPDWERLGRETRYSKDQWVRAAMLHNITDVRFWRTVEEFVNATGFDPIYAASELRKATSR